MTTQPLNADALPYAEGARFVTRLLNAFAGIGRFVRTIDQARVAAEISRDLYNLPNAALAAHGLTRADVPNYVLRKLGVFGSVTKPANENTKIAA